MSLHIPVAYFQLYTKPETIWMTAQQATIELTKTSSYTNDDKLFLAISSVISLVKQDELGEIGGLTKMHWSSNIHKK